MRVAQRVLNRMTVLALVGSSKRTSQPFDARRTTGLECDDRSRAFDRDCEAADVAIYRRSNLRNSGMRGISSSSVTIPS